MGELWIMIEKVRYIISAAEQGILNASATNKLQL